MQQVTYDQKNNITRMRSVPNIQYTDCLTGVFNRHFSDQGANLKIESPESIEDIMKEIEREGF